MTDIKSAIEQLELARNTRIFFPKDISFELAIRSLNAWEEVLQTLEESKDGYIKDKKIEPLLTVMLIIEIINQKLAEIEEVR